MSGITDEPHIKRNRVIRLSCLSFLVSLAVFFCVVAVVDIVVLSVFCYSLRCLKLEKRTSVFYFDVIVFSCATL